MTQQREMQAYSDAMYHTLPEENPADPNDACYSIVVFLVGFLCCPVWFGGCIYRKSKNQVAKIFGILSLVLLVLTLILIVVLVILFVVASARAAKIQRCQKLTTAAACFADGCDVCKYPYQSAAFCTGQTRSQCEQTSSYQFYTDMNSFCSSYSLAYCPPTCAPLCKG